MAVVEIVAVVEIAAVVEIVAEIVEDMTEVIEGDMTEVIEEMEEVIDGVTTLVATMDVTDRGQETMIEAVEDSETIAVVGFEEEAVVVGEEEVERKMSAT